MKIAFVIPTRNRADLAIGAVQSLIDRQGCATEVLVSDNSSAETEARRLSDFCDRRDRDGLTYLRPPEPMSMGTHWDWALREALARSDATHLAVHYDRKVSRPGHFGALAGVIARYPDRLITYPVDSIVGVPVRVWQPPQTGRVYRVRTAHVLSMAARGRISDMGHAWPVLSNCVVPRTVLESMLDRFGDLCDAIGPDSRFGFRFCASYDDFLHVDRTLGILHASHRSAGLGFLAGDGGDLGDFRSSWGDRPWLDAAPLPGVSLGQNMSYHEYELVRRETEAGRVPPIDFAGYLQELSLGLPHVEDEVRRAELTALLEQHGWRPPPPPAPGASTAPRRRLRGALAGPLVRLRHRPAVTLFLADHLGRTPAMITGFPFRDDEQALRYALAYPRRETETNPLLAPMEPEEVLGAEVATVRACSR